MKEQNTSNTVKKKATPVKKSVDTTPVIKEEAKTTKPVITAAENPKVTNPPFASVSEKNNNLASESIYKNYNKIVDDYRVEFDEIKNVANSNKELNNKDNIKLATDYNASVVVINKNYAKILDKVKAETQKVEDTYTKAIEENEKHKSDEVMQIDPRAKQNKDQESKASKAVLETFNNETKEIGVLEAEYKATYDKALAEELARKAEVDSKRADLILNEDNSYEELTQNLKSQFDSDVQALNEKIELLHKEYTKKIQNTKDSYNKEVSAINDSESKLQGDTEQKIKKYETLYNNETTKFNSNLNKATNEQNKAGISEAKKGLKLTSSKYQSDKSVAEKELAKAKAINDKQKSIKKSELDTNLHNMKQDFIKSIPPVENKIRLRQYQYAVDVLKALNAKKKQDNARELALYSEKVENSFINSTIEKDYQEGLLQVADKKQVSDKKYALGLKLVSNSTEVFKANEEFKMNVINLKDELNKNKATYDKLKSIELLQNESKLAEINNKYSLIEKANELKYNIMNTRFNYVFATVNNYYNVLNKRNGFSLQELMSISSDINNSQTSITDEQAYELYNNSFNGYLKDTEVSDKGVLDDKFNLIKKNQNEMSIFAKARYELEKAKLTAEWNAEIETQEIESNNKINSLNNELANKEEDIKNRLSNDNNILNSKLNQLTAIKEQDQKEFDDFKASSLSTMNNAIKSLIGKLEKEKASIKEALNQLKAKNEEKNQALNFEIANKEKEQLILNAKSEKTTLKTINFLLKKGEIVANSKWWVVEL